MENSDGSEEENVVVPLGCEQIREEVRAESEEEQEEEPEEEGKEVEEEEEKEQIGERLARVKAGQGEEEFESVLAMEFEGVVDGLVKGVKREEVGGVLKEMTEVIGVAEREGFYSFMVKEMIAEIVIRVNRMLCGFIKQSQEDASVVESLADIEEVQSWKD
mmetsp:Transcript_43433/g.51109  ORF Transcript_43433/g.51109 Transcript_43433/m.51109 type:complete len:161 (+) Transcript_43433:3-485(+)